jgi:hypothetical protein
MRFGLMAMSQSISEILKAAAAYLELSRRSALAIFLAAISFTAAAIVSALLGRGWEWWTYLVPVIVWSGTMFFYRPRSLSRQAAKRRRQNEKIAVSSIEKLNLAEVCAISYIYHDGGSCRARANPVFAELERLHLLERADPLTDARTPMWQIPKSRRLSRALRREFGRPDPTKATDQPPWRAW